MITYTQLVHIRKKLLHIKESPYFSYKMDSFLKELKNTVDLLEDSYSKNIITSSFVSEIIHIISNASIFFTGSSSNRIPYEIVFCLEDAYNRWMKEDIVITTALSPEMLGYYIQFVPFEFYTLLKSEFKIEFESKLVQISLPEIYRRDPLYSTPLYHELGHYVDACVGISKTSLLIIMNDSKIQEKVKSYFSSMEPSSVEAHISEFFADLFSAQYTGRSGIEFLQKIAGNAPASLTHPATKLRASVVNDFLLGRSNPLIELFDVIISRFHHHGILKLKKFERINCPIDIKMNFDNIRPYEICSRDELHSFIESSWLYLCEMWKKPNKTWNKMNEQEDFNIISEVINNLTEKSIRNFMIREKWDRNFNETS